MQCLDANFDVKIAHNSGPLGLIPKEITINKKACEIQVFLNSFFVVKRRWVIDVCREPVHVKYKNNILSPEVLRRKGVCPKRDDGFCETSNVLQTEIQNNGLVYAQGEKEQLGTDHGKTYCSYLLIKKYTDEGFIFSREKEYSNIIFPGSQPAQNESSKPTSPGSGAF